MLQVVYTQTPASTQEVILIPQGSAQPGIQQGGFQSTTAQQYVVQAPSGMGVAPPAYTTVQPDATQTHSQQAGYKCVCECFHVWYVVCVCMCECFHVWHVVCGVCVCFHVCVCVYVCVCLHDN